jgi:hypothetical protein
MAHKISPVMKAWLKHGHSCRVALGIKPFKKVAPGKKKKLTACVLKKARLA